MRIPSLATLAAGVLFSACASAGTPANEQVLRVMTFNIQAGGHGLDSVADAIRANRPDIVGLQEVDVHWSERSHFADEAAELAARLAMHVAFAPIYRFPGANPSQAMREYGVALLSRFPVVESRNDSLTRLSTQEQSPRPVPMPGLLEAVVDVAGVRLRLWVTHLDYRADPTVRAMQVSETIQHLAAHGGPTILLGDLNATPQAAELQPLLRVLHDAWSGDGGATYPAENPVKRIDYVLTSSHLQVVSARVSPAIASDHRAVIVELRMPRTQAPRP